MLFGHGIACPVGLDDSKLHLPVTAYPIVAHPEQAYSPKSTSAGMWSPLMPAASSLSPGGQLEMKPAAAVPVTNSEPPASSPVSSYDLYTGTKVIKSHHPSTGSANIHDAMTSQVSASFLAEPSLIPSGFPPAFPSSMYLTDQAEHTDFIFQHEDAGIRIRELPPPYVDRPAIRDLPLIPRHRPTPQTKSPHTEDLN
jgi:hypothetical protein